jgi:hypothetical protein
MRFFPHQNDSGGFFVAVLEKNAEAVVAVPRLPHKPLCKWREPPFRPLAAISREIAEAVIAEYGLGGIEADDLFVHDDSAVNNIYFAMPKVGEIVKGKPKEELRAMSAGVRLFTWKSLTAEGSVCAVPCIEGIRIVGRLATKRVIEFGEEEVRKLLNAGNEGVAVAELDSRLMEEPPGGFLVRLRRRGLAYGAIRIGDKMKIYLKRELVAAELLRIDEHEEEQ